MAERIKELALLQGQIVLMKALFEIFEEKCLLVINVPTAALNLGESNYEPINDNLKTEYIKNGQKLYNKTPNVREKLWVLP